MSTTISQIAYVTNLVILFATASCGPADVTLGRRPATAQTSGLLAEPSLDIDGAIANEKLVFEFAACGDKSDDVYVWATHIIQFDSEVANAGRMVCRLDGGSRSHSTIGRRWVYPNPPDGYSLDGCPEPLPGGFYSIHVQGSGTATRRFRISEAGEVSWADAACCCPP
jgi:hypothetical protein